MSDRNTSRKLAVILHADVAGSTALVKRNEALAHDRITDAFTRFSHTIERYNGTVHEIRGDALVAEFARASDAVCAALAFQKTSAEHNAGLDGDIKPAVRVGICMGEVIIADETVTGAGVVLAQRVEQLATPQGTNITGAILEAIPDWLPLDFENLGEQEVKGFEKPVRVYGVSVKSGQEIPPPEPVKVAHRRWKLVVTAGIAVIAIGVLLAWVQLRQPHEQPASMENMAFPLPEKPSIVVLPFKDTSDSSNQSYLANGTSDAIRWALARCPTLFVVDGRSTRAVEDKLVSAKRAAEKLGVRYVLEGSVQASEDRVRIGAQLIDALDGRHVWAEVYDGKPAHIFDFQDNVSRKIVDALEVALTEGEMIRIWRRQTENPEAYRLFREGFDTYNRRTREGNAKARELFNAALDLDPEFAEAKCQLGWTYVLGAFRGWEKDLKAAFAQGEELATVAIEEDPGYPHAYALLGSIYVWRDHDPDKALEQFEKAVELEPNHGTNVANWAWALAMAGKPDEALEAIESAMRISPYYPEFYLGYVGVIYLQLERYDDAIAAFEQRFKRNPRSSLNKMYLVAAYALADKPEKAKGVAAALLERRSKFNLDSMVEWMPFKHATERERILTAAEEGGLPRSSIQ